MDTGLGKHGQGPVDFIQVKEKLGRRGLGFMVNGFEPARVQRNMEIVDSVLQEPDWLPEDEVGVPSEEDFRKWLLDQVRNFWFVNELDARTRNQCTMFMLSDFHFFHACWLGYFIRLKPGLPLEGWTQR